MHVLFLPSWYPSGPKDIAGSFFREQALAMHNSGCKVGVIAPALLSPIKPFSALKVARGVCYEDDQGIPTYRSSRLNFTPKVWPLIARRMVRATRLLYDAYVAQEGHPDLIHVHSALPAGAGALDINDRLGIPFVLSEHNTAFARAKINTKGKKIVRRISLGASDRFAVSAPFARLLEETIIVPAKTFSVMPNMVDDAFLNIDFSQKKSGIFNFLHISLLDDKKNIPVLIHAFAARFRGQADITLTIGGQGPARPALEALARTLDINEQVSFPGELSRSQVRAALSKSDAFVLPSRFETFGVVLVEALAMGVPVIATRSGGPEDIVTESNGILIPVDDMHALADAMGKLQKNPSAYDPQQLRDDCRARFGSEAMSQKWQNIYESVVKNAGNAR